MNRTMGFPRSALFLGVAVFLMVTSGCLTSRNSADNARGGEGADLEASGIEWSTVGLQMSRAELENLLVRLDEVASARDTEASTRLRAQRDASLIRQRLRDGDFRVGDRVALQVRGEEDLSDEFTVMSGQILLLPAIGEVSVRGVLRSEIEDHLREELSRFVHEPNIRVNSLMRISLTGEVNSPGFYAVPPDILVTDILMMAGGPTRSAGLREMRVERGSDLIWEGENLETAIIQGRTLDQLNLRAGDRLVVPAERRRDWWRIASFTVGPVLSILWFIRRS